jgi:hypothetical protein
MKKTPTPVEWLFQQYENCPERSLIEADLEKAKQLEKKLMDEIWMAARVELRMKDSPFGSKSFDEWYKEKFQ